MLELDNVFKQLTDPRLGIFFYFRQGILEISMTAFAFK